MTRPLSLAKFLGMPLVSSWQALDKHSGILYIHEVRHCPDTGLKLSGKRPKQSTPSKDQTP